MGGQAETSSLEGFPESLLDWIANDGAASESIPLLIDSYCRFLNSHGFAIRRCNLATETVHPLMGNTRHVWFDRATDPGPINPAVIVERRQYHLAGSMIDEVYFNGGSQKNPQYLASPFHRVEELGELYETVRPAGQDQPFPLFNDLATLGCTAYSAFRLNNFAGMLQKLGLSTDRPGGYDEARRAALRASVAMLTLHLNTLVEHDTKRTLARVYVGDDPGRRVCAGMINLGEVVSLDAAIWFSDIRGFTHSSDGAVPERLIERLNGYFETVASAIYGSGGEILKYIGDAVLAIFPVGEDGDRRAACEAALAALDRADAGLDALNRHYAELGEDPFAHGVGLHVGTVSYGNIGSRERLDFTVIGPAVNLASRIEGMCKELGKSALCSDLFADAACPTAEPLGAFALKGIADPVALHAPPVSVG